ncbi:MAG: hypothetical protein ACOYBP_04600 [Microbacteriaceae bacterium]
MAAESVLDEVNPGELRRLGARRLFLQRVGLAEPALFQAELERWEQVSAELQAAGQDVEFITEYQSVLDPAGAGNPQPYRLITRGDIWTFYAGDEADPDRDLVVALSGNGGHFFGPIAATLNALDAETSDVLFVDMAVLFPQPKSRLRKRSGVSLSEAVTLVSERIRELGPHRRLLFLGTSLGALPAALIGRECGADLAISFSAISPFDASWQARGYDPLEWEAQHAGTQPVPTVYVAGAGSDRDVAAARDAANVCGGTLLRVYDSEPVRHNSLKPFLEHRMLAELIAAALAGLPLQTGEGAGGRALPLRVDTEWSAGDLCTDFRQHN